MTTNPRLSSSEQPGGRGKLLDLLKHLAREVAQRVAELPQSDTSENRSKSKQDPNDTCGRPQQVTSALKSQRRSIGRNLDSF